MPVEQRLWLGRIGGSQDSSPAMPELFVARMILDLSGKRTYYLCKRRLMLVWAIMSRWPSLENAASMVASTRLEGRENLECERTRHES
jgi:hypothetical protein